MKCPLFLITSAIEYLLMNGGRSPGESPLCIKGDCAWWCEDSCAVKKLAEKRKGIGEVEG